MTRSYAAQMREFQADLDTYQRRLSNSGYGPADRERYIAGHGDPETAELNWENLIIPQAEASGELPEPPMEPLSPREQARQAAQTKTYRELSDDPTYDVFAAETPETLERRQQRIEEITEELLPEFEQVEAGLVEAEAARAGCVQVEVAQPDGLAHDDDLDL